MPGFHPPSQAETVTAPKKRMNGEDANSGHVASSVESARPKSASAG
jgi:hypothetical protein